MKLLTRERKWFFFPAAIIAATALLFAACPADDTDDTSGEDGVTYTVTFDLGYSGGTAPAPIKVEKGKAALSGFPADPVRTGYEFSGWYDGETKYTRYTAITKDVTLTAYWGDLYTVTFDIGYEEGTSPEPIILKPGQSGGILFPADPVREGYVFDGWFAGETKYDSTTAITQSVTLTAQWSESVPEEPGPPPVIERVTLDNGGYAVYKFELPDGSVWGDYTKITVDYKVDAANLALGIRSHRLMGNYAETDFTESGGYRIANLSNYNAPYILDQQPTTWEGLGAAADEWFTVTYTIDGSGKHANYVDANKPAPDATGPFYFGIGIPGNDGVPITALVRNVTLSNDNGRKKVVSTGSGFDEPTYVAYATNLDRFGRETPMVERVTLDNGGYAVYRFDLPDGSAWGDYTKITVDYKVDADNIAKTIRSHRLMGNYLESDFTESGGYRIANLNTYNGPYILDQQPTTWADLGAAADEWFTVTYTIDGSGKHANYVDANKPAPDATGPFYFGIGIPGADGTPITALVKNVTLSSDDGGKKVASTGSGFDEPTYVAYATNLDRFGREMIADENP